MGIIFYLSAQVAAQSGELSQGIAERLFSAVAKAFPGLNMDSIQSKFLLRKSAYFLTYLVLSVLTMNAIGRSSIKGVRQIAMS